MSPLTFKQHIFIEAKQGDRVGIPHLYHPTKSHLAMEYNTFVEFIDALNKVNININKIKWIITIQPNSPFLTVKTIKKILRMIKKKQK